MAMDDYKAALKKGEKVYSSLSSKSTDPYLPVLDDLTENVNIIKRVNLGIETIPSEYIVGTVNTNRSNAFSRGFYPLLPVGTEFSTKWATLYDSLENEGMREGIICYEYLGKYYVQEGNKRVSVSKCLDIPFIEGTVTRLVPERSEDPEVSLYYEYLDFYEKNKINNVRFSKPGSYAKFAELVAPGVAEWDDDTCMNVRSLFSRFKKEYLAKNGESRLKLAADDALLVYVSLLGFDDVKDKTPAQIREDLPKVWKEFLLDSQEKPIAISTQPTTEKPLMITSLIKGVKNLKIAFVHISDTERSSWVYAHELGRHYIEKDIFQGKVTTEAFFNVSVDSAEATFEELCNEGYDIIFSTSPQHIAACTKVAVLHPSVKILNCSLNTSTKSLRTYYLRTYESKYLLGIIAGAMTRNNHISYVADYPVYGTVASINAFALGARTVNPKAEIYLSWTSAKDSDPEREAWENNCDIVSNLDWSSPKNLTRKFGLYINAQDPIHLAAPIWDWGKLYETIIKSVQRGSWDLEAAAIGPQSLGYWWGLSSGAVDLVFSQNVPSLTLRFVEFMKTQIIKGSFFPISGSLRMQDGQIKNMENFDMLDLVNMDTLVDGIHGFIPGINDVKEESVGLTKVQGVIN